MSFNDSSQLHRLTDLFHNAYGLVRDDNRNGEETEILLDALQAFREKRLTAIVTNTRPRHDTPEAIIAFCEARIADSGMPEQVVADLHKSGFVLQGELFQCRWLRRTYVADIAVLNFLAKNGFPQGYQPFPEDWTPSYFADPAFHAVLNASTVSTFTNVREPVRTDDSIHEIEPLVPPTSVSIGGFHRNFVGEALGGVAHGSAHDPYRELQTQVGNHPVFRAGMLLPGGWKAPSNRSPEWEAAKALHERAVTFRSIMGRNYANQDVWERADDSEKLRRREALTNALSLEQMDLRFFHIVVIEDGKWDRDPGQGDGFYYTRPSAVPYKHAGITSIRQLLGVRKVFGVTGRTMWMHDVDMLLRPWGLSLDMTQDQIDELL